MSIFVSRWWNGMCRRFCHPLAEAPVEQPENCSLICLMPSVYRTESERILWSLVCLSHVGTTEETVQLSSETSSVKGTIAGSELSGKGVSAMPLNEIGAERYSDSLLIGRILQTFVIWDRWVERNSIVFCRAVFFVRRRLSGRVVPRQALPINA